MYRSVIHACISNNAFHASFDSVEFRKSKVSLRHLEWGDTEVLLAPAGTGLKLPNDTIEFNRQLEIDEQYLIL